MTPARSEEAARAFFGCVLEEIDSGGVAVERVRHSDRCFDYNLCVLLAALLRRTADEAREEAARVARGQTSNRAALWSAAAMLIESEILALKPPTLGETHPRVAPASKTPGGLPEGPEGCPNGCNESEALRTCPDHGLPQFRKKVPEGFEEWHLANCPWVVLEGRLPCMERRGFLGDLKHLRKRFNNRTCREVFESERGEG